MTGIECLQILREIKDLAFATVDEKGMPRNRIIDAMIVEDEKLYFCTARGKNFYKELLLNGNVAITGLNSKYQMVRLSGIAKKIEEDRDEWIDRIFLENSSMRNVYKRGSRFILEAFYIDEGNIEFFDLGKDPIYREALTLGDAITEEKGFYITDDCVRCNRCLQICPQSCIVEGKPYVIIEENCLHCGLCYEICPIKTKEVK